MMRSLRTNMKMILWIVVVAFLGTIFVVWGMKGDYAFTSPQTLAVVNGEEITYSEFYPILKRQLDQYREMYQDKFTDEMQENIKNMLLQQLVMQKMLLQTAKDMGINVSVKEIIKKIKQYPVFLDKDGKFDEEKYKDAIKNTNVPWQEIEKEEKNNTTIEKLQSLIIHSIKVSDEEIKQDYLTNNETIKAKYILVDASKFTDKTQAKNKADEIRNKINTGMGFESAANEADGLKETEEFTRKQTYLNTLGTAANFVKTAFSLKQDTISEPVDVEKGYAILKVISRKGVDESKFEAEKETLKQNLIRTKSYLLFSEWVQELKNKAKIKILSENLKNI